MTTILQDKRRTEQGERTHRTILKAAIEIASVEGLEGLSIGRLASQLKMSKSGLFAHFGSKEDLQLATLRAARSLFIRYILEPARAEPHGLKRLWLLCTLWLEYMQCEICRGGCFFSAASIEYSGRPGKIRDQIEIYMGEWLCALEKAVSEAQGDGHLARDREAAQLAFEINALAMGGNWANQLFGKDAFLKRARTAILANLKSWALVPLEPVLDPPL